MTGVLAMAMVLTPRVKWFCAGCNVSMPNKTAQCPNGCGNYGRRRRSPKGKGNRYFYTATCASPRSCGKCSTPLAPGTKKCRKPKCWTSTRTMPAVVAAPDADSPLVAQIKRVALIEEREAHAKKMLESWTRKLARAETKVKKYQRKVTYYENRHAGGAVDAQEESEP